MAKVVSIADAVPSQLGEESRRLWRDLSRDYGLDDAAARALLLQLCEALDWLRHCQGIVAKDGATVPGSRRGTTRPHPLLREIAEARRHMLACFRALNLDLTPPE